MVELKQSIVSYPQRGPWGDWKFRGNCSGYLIHDLIDTYKPALVYDPMSGSGTTGEVCAERAVPCVLTDIRQGFDLLDRGARHRAELIFEDLGKRPDMIFFHPPYWNMIRYVSSPNDLSNSSTYDSYLARMESIISWLSSIMAPNGIIALLLADLRHKASNTTYFLTDDVTSRYSIARAGLIKEFRFIKVQHMTESGGQVGYPVQMVHEYVTILRKPESKQ